MPKIKTLLALLLALTLFAGCGGQSTAATTAPSVPQTAPYTVSIHTQGSMALPGIQVYVYADDTQDNLVAFGETDEEGFLTLEMPKAENYAIVLGGVPDGFFCEETYPFTGSAAEITLSSQLITGESLSTAQLGLGDVMYDFTVALPDGSELTLSELLAERDMVLLNFFFTTCGPCASEFPYMQQAYEEYSDSVAILALDPLEDSMSVANYQASMGLTFPMAACSSAWSQAFNISGYPTSVVIDRYGVICLIEVGGITSLRPFTTMFDHFSADNYQQKLYGSLSELVTNVKPIFSMPASDEMSAVLNSEALEVTYRPETDPEDSEYAWPFILTEKNGERCIKASNQRIEGSFSILYADVTLKAGQALGFDYISSTEKGCDVLFVIVEGQDMLAISGYDDAESWKTCYPWVAPEDGTYEVALCYLKDGDTNVADDTVYIRNFHAIAAEDIDVPTYIPRQAATPAEGTDYTYVDIFLSQEDGYYHVGSPDGPLLLADLMNYTQFYEEQTVWDLCYNGVVTRNGKNIYDDMVNYFSYASNSQNNGICTVNEELAQWLQLVDECAGFDAEDRREWLKLCKYYAPYGTEQQLSDPIAGLTKFSAYQAKLGKNIESNHFYYDRPIMPRGLLAKFTPPFPVFTESAPAAIRSRA